MKQFFRLGIVRASRQAGCGTKWSNETKVEPWKARPAARQVTALLRLPQSLIMITGKPLLDFLKNYFYFNSGNSLYADS